MKMGTRARSFRNRLFFRFRRLANWQKGLYQEPAEPKEALFDGRPESTMMLAREQELVAAYALDAFRQNSSRNRYLETLTYLDFLERLIPPGALPAVRPLRWLDAGAKNWAYVQALASFIERDTCDYKLVGIELDAYPVYRDLHSRYDYARTFIRPLPNAVYQPGDVLAHTGTYDVISSFLPFVFADPCLAWGLPLEHFQPGRYLDHLISLLAPGGLLLVLNQGPDEAKAQEALFEGISGLAVRPLGSMPPSFLEYRYPRYGWRCCKP